MMNSNTLQVLKNLYYQAHSYKSEVDHYGKPVSDVVERLAAALAEAQKIVNELGPNCPTCGSANTKFLNPHDGTGPAYFICRECGREWDEGGREEEFYEDDE